MDTYEYNFCIYKLGRKAMKRTNIYLTQWSIPGLEPTVASRFGFQLPMLDKWATKRSALQEDDVYSCKSNIHRFDTGCVN